jgi:LEA14-like dessication related protein
MPNSIRRLPCPEVPAYTAFVRAVNDMSTGDASGGKNTELAVRVHYTRGAEAFMNRFARATAIALLAATALVLTMYTGCAGGPKEVPAGPPTVEVASLKSTVFTPHVIRFEGQIIIRNRMRESLDFDRVQFDVDLFDTRLFDYTWDGLDRAKPGGRQTVTFPFRIAMEDVAAQAVDLLAEGSLRVGLGGTVYPDPASGVGPMRFYDELVIPLPSIPTVTLARAYGNPLGQSFRVHLDVWNPNAFPLSVHSIESYVEVNERRYDLLHTVGRSEIGPDQTETIELTMENTIGKSLSMILNVMQSDEPTFRVGGTVTARTPYGWVYIPVEIESPTR